MRRLAEITEDVLVSQYSMDSGATRANPALEQASRRKLRERSQAAPQDPLDDSYTITDSAVFDQDRVWDYIAERPLKVARQALYLLSIAGGIWSAWRQKEEGPARGHQGSLPYTASLSKRTMVTKRGEVLREGLADMGVFFVKCGQTLAQRPDLVGDELAEELKGLQEKNSPFADEVALQIIAEDLGHRGPLAPGVLWPGCEPSEAPLLAALNPKHVASASLGQVYRGRLHDGREVALKVQRPGVRGVLGLDWAIAVVAMKLYRTLTSGFNDYSLIVDTVAKGIRMELDYHNEAANAEEFAVRHAFLPFVSSPGWVPEYTGGVGSARVLCLEWYPSRAPSELNREERRCLVEMAVEACVVQLLVTGFVHADPHEGNLRLGDDGRIVFLDFGLMDRVDFGVMECFAAGIRHVLSQDWMELARVMQEVRFTPTPLCKFVRDGDNVTKGFETCSIEEFSTALGEQMQAETGGTSRFGAMATALKKLSDRYLMLTPPYVALLCRTFITLEGLLGDDPQLAEEFNIYEVALPFAVRRVLSPRTRKGQAALRAALLKEEPRARARAREGSSSAARGALNWPALVELLGDTGSADTASASASAASSQEAAGRERGNFGATEGVQRRLLRTSEGAALRRFLYDVDVFEELRSFLLSSDTRPLRRKAVDALAERWAARSLDRGGAASRRRWGPRCRAAAKRWGEWRRDDPYVLPAAALRTSRQAWRLVLRRQLRLTLWPPWRLPYRTTLGVGQLVCAVVGLGLRVVVKAVRLQNMHQAHLVIESGGADAREETPRALSSHSVRRG